MVDLLYCGRFASARRYVADPRLVTDTLVNARSANDELDIVWATASVDVGHAGAAHTYRTVTQHADQSRGPPH